MNFRNFVWKRPSVPLFLSFACAEMPFVVLDSKNFLVECVGQRSREDALRVPKVSEGGPHTPRRDLAPTAHAST